MSYTKGPWILNGENSQGYKVVCRGPETGWNIALVLPPALDSKPQSKEYFEKEWLETANLIAAAPDLLEACKSMLTWLQNIQQNHPQAVDPKFDFKNLRSVIFRAEAK